MFIHVSIAAHAVSRIVVKAPYMKDNKDIVRGCYSIKML